VASFIDRDEPEPDEIAPRVGDAHTHARTIMRQSFNIFVDQDQALGRLQTQLYEQTGKKPTKGELVQQALDEYIKTRL
jgi:hypothetical protein